jgi:Flp pilus assembly protein TadD
MSEQQAGRPAGEVYDWYRRGLELLANGNPQAAAQVLAHAHEEEPTSKSIREALARAQFNARRYSESARNFRQLVEEDPTDDYAHFALGLALNRLGDRQRAAGHLAMATAMRPGSERYAEALDKVRGTLEARDRDD